MLIDYHLNDGTGDSVVWSIRRVIPTVRIIMMSADATGVAREAAHRVGTDAYIDKLSPFSRFLDIVRQVVKGGSPSWDAQQLGDLIRRT